MTGRSSTQLDDGTPTVILRAERENVLDRPLPGHLDTLGTADLQSHDGRPTHHSTSKTSLRTECHQSLDRLEFTHASMYLCQVRSGQLLAQPLAPRTPALVFLETRERTLQVLPGLVFCTHSDATNRPMKVDIGSTRRVWKVQQDLTQDRLDSLDRCQPSHLLHLDLTLLGVPNRMRSIQCLSQDAITCNGFVGYLHGLL
jgi:hypothetical protein